MVKVVRRYARCAIVLGLLLFGASACSSFDPVEETRFELLYTDTYDALDMSGAHWVTYDDQHSSLAACTNGAAGAHLPSECSEVYAPWDDRPDPQCPPTEDELLRGYLADPGADGSICIQGVLHPYLPCVHDDTQCYKANSGERVVDQSNMWGAGVGLAFSATAKTAWDATKHRVRGIAFDFSGPDETRLVLRVDIPIVLDPNTHVPDTRPFIRSDGSVLGKDGTIHDCRSNQVLQSGVKRRDTKLSDALVAERAGGVVTSELHPYGSPFWQLPPTNPSTPSWGFSPVKLGHNEVEWGDIRPPPEAPPPDPNNYSFAKTQILGVHFQVAHQMTGSLDDLNFAFCIKNLAVLFER